MRPIDRNRLKFYQAQLAQAKANHMKALARYYQNKIKKLTKVSQ